MVGGKLTTHRALAQEAVDLIFATLGRRGAPCRTAEEPLPGGRAGDWPRFADGFRTGCGLPPEVSDHLLEVYGVRAADVLDYAAGDVRLLAPLPGTNAIAAEIPFAIRNELATSLSDVFLRRTMIGLGGGLGLEALPAATEIARVALRWSEERLAAEAAAYTETACPPPGKSTEGRALTRSLPGEQVKGQLGSPAWVTGRASLMVR